MFPLKFFLIIEKNFFHMHFSQFMPNNSLLRGEENTLLWEKKEQVLNINIWKVSKAM
jgi:hypothetical protein